jgi:hypothetical protein
MWMEKLRRGVLALETDSGVRYLKLSFLERIRLVWTFRNFRVLPEEVLHAHERALVEALCRKGRFLANCNGHGDLSEVCIGIVERLNPRKLAHSERGGSAGSSQRPPVPTVLSRAG